MLRQIRVVSIKWTYHEKRSFASSYFIFLKILFQLKDLLQKSWFDVPATQIFILFVSAVVIFEGAFSL